MYTEEPSTENILYDYAADDNSDQQINYNEILLN